MTVRNLIDALVAGDSLAIENSFDDVMSLKISNALDARKTELAQSMFAAPVEEIEQISPETDTVGEQ